MKHFFFLVFTLFCTSLIAQKGSYSLSASTGLLYQDNEWLFSKPGHGLEVYGKYFLRERIYAIANISSYSKSTFPFDVDMSPETFYDENGIPQQDSHTMPHRMREHLFNLGPMALSTNYSISRFLTFGLGVGAKVIRRKNVHFEFAALLNQQNYSDIRLIVNEINFRNGEFVNFEYDYAFWNQRTYGLQIKNIMRFPITENISVLANIDWFVFENSGKAGGWTRSYTVLSTGLHIGIPSHKSNLAND